MRITTRAKGQPTTTAETSFRPHLNGGEDANLLALVGVTVRGDSHVIWLSRDEAVALIDFLDVPATRQRIKRHHP
jgi:hypothetical protein